MIDNLFTKENFALLGVVALFLWRIVDFMLRQKKKKETELQKLAFDMAKYHFGEETDPFTRGEILQFYFYYLDMLEHNLNPHDQKSFKVLNEFGEQIREKIKAIKEMSAKFDVIEDKLSIQNDVSPNDLWERSFNWSMWFRHTKKLLKKTFIRRAQFHSVR
jgi:hypothetical protein